jgi:hypothetical protein
MVGTSPSAQKIHKNAKNDLLITSWSSHVLKVRNTTTDMITFVDEIVIEMYASSEIELYWLLGILVS